MDVSAIKQYDHLTLKDLSDKLNINYYEIIRGLVRKAEEKLAALKNMDLTQITASYTEACEKLLHKISEYLNERRDILKPYLEELQKKQATGHDCSFCSGSCDIGHKSHILMLKESHYQITQLLYKLQSVALPLYANTILPPVYRDMRYEMLLIDMILRQLFFTEEASLMPQIIKSQKKINIHD